MSQSKKSMHVLELKIENIGPIRRVEIIPKGDLIYLTGKNGAGKTTALDAMSWALQGGNSFSSIPQIVRDGAEEGEVVVDLGDYIVKRTWKSDHDYRLELLAKLPDGGTTKITERPQSVIDAFGETVGFDPLWYSRTSGDDRIEYLKRFIEADIDRLEHERKKVYQERRDIGRDKRNVDERLKGKQPPREDLPEEKIDVVDLSKELEEAQAHNSKIERAEEKLENKHSDLGVTESRIESLKKELEAAEKRKAAIEESIKEGEKWIKNNERIDTDPIREQMEKAEEVNDEIRQAEKYRELEAELDELSQKWDEKTKEIEEFDEKKRQAIAEADFPVEDLNIGEDDVYIGERAFSRLSEGERLKYGSMIAIGSNPRFKVLAVREGEKLDSENLEILKEIAAEHGFQLWIEKMDESGDVGFVFENGEIKKEN